MPATASHPAPRRIGWVRSLLASPGRRLALGVFLGFAALIGGTVWRMRSLDGLPDVGDPFDVAEMRRPIDLDDADNAFVAYRAASQGLENPPNPIDESRWELFRVPLWEGDIKALTWSLTIPKRREYVEARRAALEIWREGSGRRDALYYQPAQFEIGSVVNLLDEAAILSGMAALEGSRLEQAGAMDDAWDWYRAILRCSRLVGRHGGLFQRVYGAKIHAQAARLIVRWAADPRVGAGLLRRALHDTLAADALTPPVSEAVKIDHLACLRSLRSVASYHKIMLDFGRPYPLLGGRQNGLLDRVLPWTVRIPLQRIRVGISNELERSRRAFRLLHANWLAQADRPPGRQAPLAVRRPIWIHANDPTAPAARAVSPEVLASALERLEIAFLLGDGDERGDPPWGERGELTRERRRRSVLIVRLAAELYRREHGITPATAAALLGTALKELPEGIAAGDPIPGEPE